MDQYQSIIGLEIHIQLDTKRKLFCRCKNEFNLKPNVNVCPVCLGLPGTLPVLNRETVQKAVILALALNMKINQFSLFSRKNYFYPDLPKGYQITMTEFPLATNGYFLFEHDLIKHKIDISQVHLEEDAGKLTHCTQSNQRKTYIDFNRSGIPLLEIVTAPQFKDPRQVRVFCQNFTRLLHQLNICRCNLSEGNIRFDVNVSVFDQSLNSSHARVEVKNLNSFKFIEDASRYEIQRQQSMLLEGNKITQETRQYDPQKKKTQTIRKKETIKEYRYFPEPDLKPLKLTSEFVEKCRECIPELPQEKKEKFRTHYGLSDQLLDIMISNVDIANFYEETMQIFNEPIIAANWLIRDVRQFLNKQKIALANSKLTPPKFTELLNLLIEDKITVNNAKQVLTEMIVSGESAGRILQAKKLIPISSDVELEQLISILRKKYPDQLEEYFNGKEKILSFLIGKVMEISRGQADPNRVKNMLVKEKNSRSQP